MPNPVTSTKTRQNRWFALLATVATLLLVLLPRVTAAQSTVLVLDETGAALKDVVIWLSSPSMGTHDTPTPAQPVDRQQATSRPAIDQLNKRFEPYVTVVKPGTAVFFPNSDNIRHHVYSFSAGNAFERKLYRANEAEPVTFKSPGIVALGCNIHDNMQAYVLVSDDWVALTDATGQVTLHDNSQTVMVWHPLLGDKPLQISLQELETNAADSYVLRLPFTWTDPQAPRSDAQLESLLKQFSRDPG